MRTTRSMRWISPAVALLSLGLAGCPGPTKAPSAEQPVPIPPGIERAPRGATIHRIDPAASRVAIEVFRGGPLARIGHNHVVTSQDVTGQVYLAPQLEHSAFDLQLSVRDLIVDDPDARREAGEQFPPDLPSGARESTRDNMLGPDVLAADRYPQVRIRSVEIAGQLPEPRVVAAIELRGVTRTVEPQVGIDVDGDRLRIHGAFALRQSDFGITPFSVALGSLTVQDELRIRFDLIATPIPR
jgi:polyisoprenoid-binding protein YceI